MATGKKRSKRPKISEEALDYLCRELESLGVRELDIDIQGGFCYVTHAGSPLCRLGYRGEIEKWDFAIYKYSSQRYATGTDLFPLFGGAKQCVSIALNAYNLV